MQRQTAQALHRPTGSQRTTEKCTTPSWRLACTFPWEMEVQGAQCLLLRPSPAPSEVVLLSLPQIKGALEEAPPPPWQLQGYAWSAPSTATEDRDRPSPCREGQSISLALLTFSSTGSKGLGRHGTRQRGSSLPWLGWTVSTYGLREARPGCAQETGAKRCLQVLNRQPRGMGRASHQEAGPQDSGPRASSASAGTLILKLTVPVAQFTGDLTHFERP